MAAVAAAAPRQQRAYGFSGVGALTQWQLRSLRRFRGIGLGGSGGKVAVEASAALQTTPSRGGAQAQRISGLSRSGSGGGGGGGGGSEGMLVAQFGGGHTASAVAFVDAIPPQPQPQQPPRLTSKRESVVFPVSSLSSSSSSSSSSPLAVPLTALSFRSSRHTNPFLPDAMANDERTSPR